MSEQERRLSDTLLKFKEAREDLVRELGVGSPLSSADSGHRVQRILELQRVIEVIEITVAAAPEVSRERRAREARKAEIEDRRAELVRRTPE